MRQALTAAALCLAALCLAAQPAAADTITLRADEWCPYNCDPKSGQPGYMVEIATRAFEAAGHKVDYQLLNWERAKADAAEGRVSGIVGASQSEGRQFFFPKRSLGMSRNGFFVKTGVDWRFAGVDSLKGRQVATILGYSYGDALDAFLAANKGQVQAVGGDQPLLLNLRKLAAGRVDVLVEDVNVAGFVARRHAMAEGLTLAGQDSPSPLYIAFSAKDAKAGEYGGILDSAVEAYRRSGELAAILGRYGMRDWAE